MNRLPRINLNLVAVLLALLALLAPLQSALAHKPSDSYLAISAKGAAISGQWDIALRDLEYAIGLDADGNGEITWGAVKAKHADIASYALARLAVRAGDSACPLRATAHLIDEHSDGAYAVLRFEGECARAPDALDIRYGLLFDFDSQHKGLLRLESEAGTLSGIFAADRSEQRFELHKRSALEQFLNFGHEGVWHIWKGFDHVLFLLSLLLPAVLVFRRQRWEQVQDFRPAFWDVVRVVTSFTIAHSITLSLAALQIIWLPSRLVESTIAFSVLLAALNNIRPVVEGRRWMMAFAFGLIHGFGFASVLTDLGLPRDSLLLALVGFNLGVEAGQLVIVSVFLPLAFMLRSTPLYRRGLMHGGSLLIALVALIWMLERIFDLRIITLR